MRSADNQQGRPDSEALDPGYIAGFVDGEGSFHVAIYKDPRMRSGLKVIPEFHVSQRDSSRAVLDGLVRSFRCGYVKANHAGTKDRTFVYVVRNRKDLLERVIPFFQGHRLRTEKRRDLARFATIVRIMEHGGHRNHDDLSRILTLAYAMNNGGVYRRRKHSLSGTLRDYTPNPTKISKEI